MRNQMLEEGSVSNGELYLKAEGKRQEEASLPSQILDGSVVLLL